MALSLSLSLFFSFFKRLEGLLRFVSVSDTFCIMAFFFFKDSFYASPFSLYCCFGLSFPLIIKYPWPGPSFYYCYVEQVSAGLSLVLHGMFALTFDDGLGRKGNFGLLLFLFLFFLCFSLHFHIFVL